MAQVNVEKRNKKTYYTVVKYSPNSWYPDGAPVIERESGTRHRSPRAAAKKLSALLNHNRKTGTWSAAWHNARVVAVEPGGIHRGLTPEEYSETYL